MSCGKCRQLDEKKIRIFCKIHSFHLSCLGKDLPNFLNQDDCSFCKFIYYNQSKNSKVCINCKSCLENHQKCKLLKSFCDNCLPKFMDSNHVASCDDCNSKFKNYYNCPNCKSIQPPLKNSQLTIEFDNQCKFCMENSIPPSNSSWSDQPFIGTSMTDEYTNSNQKIIEKNNQTIVKNKDEDFNNLSPVMLKKKPSLDNLQTGNSIFRFESKCCFCNKPSNLAYLCNHNLCYECLCNNCIRPRLTIFIENVKNGRWKAIDSKFEVRCGFKDCQEVLKFPACFFGLLGLSYEEKHYCDEFLPYFDGISFKFSKCQCKFVVAKFGSILLGCQVCKKFRNYG